MAKKKKEAAAAAKLRKAESAKKKETENNPSLESNSVLVSVVVSSQNPSDADVNEAKPLSKNSPNWSSS